MVQSRACPYPHTPHTPFTHPHLDTPLHLRYLPRPQVILILSGLPTVGLWGRTCPCSTFTPQLDSDLTMHFGITINFDGPREARLQAVTKARNSWINLVPVIVLILAVITLVTEGLAVLDLFAMGAHVFALFFLVGGVAQLVAVYLFSRNPADEDLCVWTGMISIIMSIMTGVAAFAFIPHAIDPTTKYRLACATAADPLKMLDCDALHLMHKIGAIAFSLASLALFLTAFYSGFTFAMLISDNFCCSASRWGPSREPTISDSPVEEV
eukprot:Blabericola_migrator_1__3163@NODE_1924_length_3555_cov_22_552466_g1230_i0_p1_GENE_NODE_1924_length_3555_cov_22_552466_g1230_i0NODE_1924_length_3555_cov_22_552466_g1230_i0_p1_ORF_typecomplete_len268_score26_64TssN/PF17555_2/0_0098TssN/PF17555_2/5e03DUF1700/PF08006_11/0_045DUF1700/PF08006_11/27Tmemb_161AB/PF10268_9/0_88_NODE_1924_length_3555_cov_22_552466_g1230_i015972400